MKRGFYTSLAGYYESIFSLSEGEKRFYDSFGIENTHSVMDIGCGTGELSRYLGRRAGSVLAFDSDPDMIARALDELDPDLHVTYVVGDMMKLSRIAGRRKFDFAFCMGNTLVHVRTKSKLLAFFREIRRTLAINGKFVFQTLNYGKSVKLPVREFPVIENELLVFTRRYEARSSGELLFHTELRIKATNEVHKQEIVLHPYLFDEIVAFSQRVGLAVVNSFGGFDKTPYSEESNLLVCELAVV